MRFCWIAVFAVILPSLASADDIVIINRPDGTTTTVESNGAMTSWVNSDGHGGGQSGRDIAEVVADIITSIEAGGGSCNKGLSHLISCSIH